jgi:hypothetical protein
MLSTLARLPFFKGIWLKAAIGSVPSRVKYGIYDYPHYAYGVFWSAFLCKQLGHKSMTAIEFGVAGGRGLIALEKIAVAIGEYFNLDIKVIGFDSGSGMPEASDYRDLPHIWAKGFYKMDVELLQSKLSVAQLVIGNVSETVDDWIAKHVNSPIGFVAFDLDYYSSTKSALRVFNGSHEKYLPRVHSYFDDLGANDLSCMSQFIGEYLAITEFNSQSESKKVSRIENLRLTRTCWEKWQSRMYAFHNFAHPDYGKLVVPDDAKFRQLTL